MSQPTSHKFIQTLNVEAESLEKARKQLRSQIPTGFRFSEQVVSDGTPQTMRAVAETTEAAFAKAQKEIPSNAKVTEQKELTTPQQQVIKVEAFDEESVRRDLESRNAIVKTLKLVTSGNKGFLGIGKKPSKYEVEVFQQAVVQITYKTPTKISATIQGRGGDGTILGDLIAKGIYAPQAGSEKIGYFDPKAAPFRTFPNGKTGLLGGPEADQQMQIIHATLSTFGNMFSESKDETVNLIVKLCNKLLLRSASHLLDGFQQLTKNEALSGFLLVTTTMPFFLTYSAKQVAVIAEVDQELKLNALINFLINDESFSTVHSISEFGSKVASLLDERKEEVEEKKQWAIELQKSRNS